MRSFPLLTVLAVLSSTALPSATLADPPPGTIMKVKPPSTAQICKGKIEIQIINLKRLETALALTPQQKPLFDAWRDQRVEMARAWPCPVPPTGLDVPTPKRLENQISMMSYTLEALKKEQPSAAALYAALSPQQRAIFDGPAPKAP